MSDDFEASRAWLSGPDLFKRLRLDQAPSPLGETELTDEDELLVFEVGGSRFGIRLPEIAYHHVAQGTLDGEEVMVGFCDICHSGAMFTPIVDGKVHNFSCGGLYDGIALLVDDETESYWNHITGQCVHGPLKGKSLAIHPVQITTVAAEKQRGEAAIFTGRPTFWGRCYLWIARKAKIRSSGSIPPFFYLTMGKRDDRLERKTQGLGVVVDGHAKFYPVSTIGEGIQDTLGGRELRVWIRTEDRVPTCEFADGTIPFHLFCRWYGFSATYPECELA